MYGCETVKFIQRRALLANLKDTLHSSKIRQSAVRKLCSIQGGTGFWQIITIIIWHQIFVGYLGLPRVNLFQPFWLCRGEKTC